ncbi:MAG: hypothetical protein P8X69_14265, partial [Maritimibacter sp.]
MNDFHNLFARRTAGMKASEIRELLKLLDQPDIISFAGGIPDPALFPREAFAKALMRLPGHLHIRGPHQRLGKSLTREQRRVRNAA